jgi:hypothetical protein
LSWSGPGALIRPRRAFNAKREKRNSRREKKERRKNARLEDPGASHWMAMLILDAYKSKVFQFTSLICFEILFLEDY